MAKKQKPIESMEDEFEVPEAIQTAADAYNKALTANNRAKGKFNSAKESLIDCMKENDIDRVRVLADGGGARVLKLDMSHKIKVEKTKKIDEE